MLQRNAPGPPTITGIDGQSPRKVANDPLALLLRNIIEEMRRVLLCPPTYFDVIDMKNPYMVGESPVDKEKACTQWEAFRRELQAAGMKVELVDPVPGLEDMVFAANQVFVGHSKKIGKFIVPSRMRYASRQHEVQHYVEWFRQRGYKVLDIDLTDEHLEGGGDLIWHPGNSRIYAAHGFRSTLGGVLRFSEAMANLDIAVETLELCDARFYHLDTCFCPLNQEALLVYPGAFAPGELDKVCAYWKRVHEIGEFEASSFAANGVVAGDRYLTAHITPKLEKILEIENLKPVVVDTSEFEKSGGSCYCLKNFLD